MALMVLALAVDARGQRLLETDGVELRGEAQLVMSGGGTCNVLESDTAYEANKANDGAPMDIWRLDFSVRNGSGRWLDHLIARYQIDSEWPDCTNWDGPDATEFAEFIEWADSIGHIQESGRNVVAPDQTLTQTKFFIVRRGDPEPRFANWSMDFDFAVNPPPAGTAATAGTPGSPARATAATAEQENLFWQSIMNSTNPAEFEAYLAQFPNGVFRALAENRLEALRAPANVVPGGTGSRRADAAGSPGSGSRTADGTDAPLRPGDVFRDCAECPEMVVMPGGRLALGRYEVTVGEYRAFAAATGGGAGGGCNRGPYSWRDPGFPQTDRHPVTCVSWDDAQAYVLWLSRTAGVTYRLPTGAEWERAAVGSQLGCYQDRTGHRGTCPVGSYGSNAAGLSGMASNLGEWTEDCWDSGCDQRVLRGGEWGEGRGVDDWLRSNPESRFSNNGFRVARMLD